jgi:hypothetical protein
VTNSGNSTNAVLNFTIPQGAAGTGATGFAWEANFVNPYNIGGTFYIAPQGSPNIGSTQLALGAGVLLVPQSCTVSSLTVRAEITELGSDGNTDQTTITVMHNGSPTAMSCRVSLADNAPTGTVTTCNSPNTFSVTAGDLLEYQYTETQFSSTTPAITYSTQLVCQ